MRNSALVKLDPNNPEHWPIINAEWQRMRRRRARAASIKGWVRVALVCTTYLLIAAAVVAFVYLLAIVLLALAGTN